MELLSAEMETSVEVVKFGEGVRLEPYVLFWMWHLITAISHVKILIRELNLGTRNLGEILEVEI